MKRIIYACLLLLVACSQVEARTPIRNWLATMPDSVMPLLTKNNCLDFLDFYDCGMEAIVSNRVDGKSRMDTLTEDFVCINYTRTTDVRMKLLMINDTVDVLCMVTTVKAQVDDSRMAFFDSGWQPLDMKAYITEPEIEDFQSVSQGDSAAYAWNKMDVFFRTYHLNAENTDLQCVFTAMDHLSIEDREEVMPYVRKEPIVYRWVGGKYRRYE